MNSKERHENRYQRRKAKREAKKVALEQQYGDFDKVFTFEHLHRAYRCCKKGVNWKSSTQRYTANASLNVVNTLDQLRSGKFKSKGFFEFDIMERGKPRHIKSVHISERVVQRCICDYSLVPLFSRSFVYDNGACVKNKGIDFAINRLKRQLHEHYRQYGTKGYVLVFDFSKYFDNINHDILKRLVDETYSDKRLSGLINQLIDDFGGDKGLGLGSQISQISALRYPSSIDHHFKEVRRVRKSGRYMDDGYMMHISKEYLQECLKDLSELCAKIGIKLNEKKTQIVKLTRGITFLKHRFFLTETGKVVVKPARKGITRMRQKLKKFKQWLDAGRMEFSKIKDSFVSWCGHLLHCNAYRTLRSMKQLFRTLFYCNKEVGYAQS